MKYKFYYFLLSIVFIHVHLSCEKPDSSLNEPDHFFLQNSGQNMPVLVAGNKNSDKLIIILHGGPGGTSLVYRDDVLKDIVESKYQVAYWDQRYAGNTQGNFGTLALDTYSEDLKKLIQVLKSKYGNNKKIYLLGHSWGGFLAPYFLLQGDNQKMINGWLQVGGAHNFDLLFELTHAMILQIGNREISKGGEHKVKWEKMVKWCQNNGFTEKSETAKLNQFAHEAETLLNEVQKPVVDFNNLLENNISISSGSINAISSGLFGVFDKASDEQLTPKLKTINTPVLLLWGRYDFVCPIGLAENIKANMPGKDIEEVVYEKSGHSPMSNEPKQFWNDVVKWVNSK